MSDQTQTEQPKEAYAYFGTWNNPHLHCEELANFDYTTATPEQFKELQEFIIHKFVHASNRARKPESSSIIVGCEVGENGTFHTHMLFTAQRKISFENLKKYYPGIHLDMAWGSFEECLNYINKEGSEKNEAKADTKLCEPIVWGEYKYTPKDQMPQQSVFTKINALLDEGYTPEQLYAENAKFAYYANAIERTYQARRKNNIPAERKITTYYHVGQSQTGKSHTYLDLIEKHGINGVHRVAGDYKWMFEGYDGQKVLFLDEFRDAHLDYSVLLSYLDKYPIKLNIKHSSTYAAWEEIHITSVIPPEQLYMGVDVFGHDTKDQLFNRITYVVYHWKDEDGFHEYELSMSEYVDYRDLRFRAMGDDSPLNRHEALTPMKKK